MKSINIGTKVRLRMGVWEFVKIREWQIEEIQDGKLLLSYREKGYTLEVKKEDIDWDSVTSLNGPGENR